MCIPITPAVPAVTAEGIEVGTACEILCPDRHPEGAQPVTTPATAWPPDAPDELWLRVERPDGSEFYVPFMAVAEVRPDGVRLRVTVAELERRGWDQRPAGLPQARVRAA